MRVALIVGIDFYQHGSPLFGCANDANSVNDILERNGDGTPNFECKLIVARDSKSGVLREDLKDEIKRLFEIDAEVALLYFAGHGHIESSGGYLLTSDASRGDGGVSLAEIFEYANNSGARNKLVFLDSCHSGIAAASPSRRDVATLSEGLTVLTASTAEQYASEEDGQGVFSALLVDALSGTAANLTGDITPGAVYAHIDQSLGGFDQRPVFKTNVKKFVSLRHVAPPISRENIRKIPEYFPASDHEFSLDPSFEPEIKGRDPGMAPPDEENVKDFLVLQQLNRVNLVVPVGASMPNMWHAAMESKSCRLTALGDHYRRLVEKGRI